jgi:MAF protein
MQKFLLASSSPYRAQLLRQLGLVFATYSPNINEEALENEAPKEMAYRLSAEKALAAQSFYEQHVIIASDQVACLENDNTPIGKPYNAQNAVKQLQGYSGKTLRFYTGLSVIIPAAKAQGMNLPRQMTCVEHFDVTFRHLTDAQIQAYVEKEQPFNCAGSFKAEGLGIALFDKFNGRDYNTLIGLPLMALVDCFKELDIDVLANSI